MNKPGFTAGDTILVATGVYTGTGTEVVLLNKNATLSGGWNAAFTTQSGASTIDGQGARRGMTVNFGRTAVVERFAVQNGNGGSSGGGIHNRGTVTLNNCTVSGNAVSSGESYGAGGGIYNDGAATLNNCTVSGNTNDMYGGGIYSGQGTLTLNNSTVSGNKGNYGGGIFGEGIVTVQNSVIRDNDGFGIYKHGGTATLNNSAISGNRSGGIYNDGGTVIINHSAVGGNTTTGSGAGIINGGGWDAGTVTLDNSTVSGNTANEYCGGIVNGGSLTLNNSTVSGNSATLSGGGICNDNANATLRNSILSGNSASSAPDCRGTIASSGYNLIGDTSGCTFGATTGDRVGLNPMLGPLEDSPGYRPLLPGSPAVNGGNPAGCQDDKGNPLPTDQRGFPRFGRCDIGAYELQPIGFSTLTVNRAVALPGDPLTYTIVLNNPGATDIADARVTDTLPVSLSYIDNSLTATSGSASYQSGVITWNGTINASGHVTITYGATVNPTLGFVITSAAISGGGDSVTRTATVTVDGPICNLTKHAGNPVLVVGTAGSWDDDAVRGPAVLKEGNSYKMWYTGDDGANPFRIGLATSTDGTTWTKAAANPVLSPSQAWEVKGIRAGSVISDCGLYKMWYTGLDSSGDSRIGYATSLDRVNWTKYKNNPVLYTGNSGTWEDKDVERPTVFKEGSTYHLWYTGNDGMTLRIGHATSSDGINWTKDLANPVLDIGSPGAWDWLNVYGPSVVKVGAEYKLWYSGETLPQAWQTGYALSSNGSDWTRVTMLIPEGSSGAFDAASADHASVLVDGDKFKIWYSGLDKGGDQTIGYATAGICRGASVPSGRPVYLPLVVKSPQVPCPAYYTDNFGDPDSGWPVADDSSRRYAYTSGEYQIWVRNPHQGWSVTPGAKVTDFAAAVSARRTSGSFGRVWHSVRHQRVPESILRIHR